MLTEDRTRSARVWGWLSGLGWFVLPWIASGISVTFMPDPERSFNVVYGVAFLAMTAWLVIGSIRLPGFRLAAVKGAAIAAGVALMLVLLLIVAAPS